VPIEEVARCQYKTVQIIFPLNLQTITITSDVVKWRWGGPGARTKIKLSYAKNSVFHCEGCKVYCACAVSRDLCI